MALAEFKDLSIDATDASVLGPWWANVLGLEWDANEPDVGRARGRTQGTRSGSTRCPSPRR